MGTFKFRFILFIVCIILFSCEKEDNNLPKQEPSDFLFKSEINNESWLATRTWGYFNEMNSMFSLTGAKEDSVYFQEEDLSLFIMEEKIKIGEKLRDFDASLSFIIGGDGLVWRYEKTENPNESYLIINEYDSIHNRISGEFEIRLIDIKNDEEHYFNLKNGEFNMTYEITNTY